MKECGILMPIFSLPSNYGIGTLGIEAYKFIDFLVESKQKYWQILPLNQTGYGDSPYQSFSLYSGNVYFIDLDLLVEEGLLLKDEIIDIGKLDYEKLYNTRFLILKKAFNRFEVNKDYKLFCKNKFLENYALFMTMKEVNNCNIEYIKSNYESIINFYKFTQYIFYKQWFNLKKYANKNNIKIIGDMPIYASCESSDVFFDSNNYLVENNIPIKVAGCPKDYFSKEGQYWGNPIYNWNYIKENNFILFKEKFDFYFKIFDKVRIDHFRGLSSYYAINYNDKATNGRWYKAYGKELFDTLKLDKEKIIIEDLGYITKDVIKLIEDTKFTSMRVAIFGLDKKNIHLPCNYKENIVAYTTTHDNVPINGWKKKLNKKELSFLLKYLNCSYDNICDKLIEDVYKSNASLVIIPIQDILNLDESSTINIPNTLGNWKFRIEKESLNNEIISKLSKLVIKYNR